MNRRITTARRRVGTDPPSRPAPARRVGDPVLLDRPVLVALEQVHVQIIRLDDVVDHRPRLAAGVLVGFGGGVGGFYLASSLGLAKQWAGSPSAGFLIFAALALVALGGLTSVKKRWRTTWGAAIQGVRI